MKFSSEFIDQVLEANNLVDIISNYTSLRPAGHNLMGRCPFPDHPEKTPSFSVSLTKQVYYCFGCQKKGNIFTFLRDMQGLSYTDAVEYLAGRASIALPAYHEDKEADQQQRLHRELCRELIQINRQGAEFFQRQLQALSPQSEVWNYIRSRGLSDQIIEEFQLGWAGDSWTDLVNYFQQRQVPLAKVEQARLIKFGQDQRPFDLFRKRWMFPILNSLGESIGFGGRVLPGEGEPKYLNSPESPVFHKGKILYALSIAAKYIRAEDEVIVVEGYMDTIALHQAGLKQTVATLGTSLTYDHIRLLKRHTSRVVLLFDGDQAGQNASERTLPLFLEMGLMPKVLVLPGGADPDDFVKSQGSGALRELLNEAPDLYAYILKKWMEGYRGDVSQKLEILGRLSGLLMRVSDSRLRGLCLEEASRRLGMTAQSLEKEIFGNTKPSTENKGNSVFSTKAKGAEIAKESPEAEIVLKGAPKLELVTLSLVLKRERFLHLALERGLDQDLVHPGVQQAWHWMKSSYGQNPSQFDRFLSLLSLRVDVPENLMMVGMAENFENEFSAEEIQGRTLEKDEQMLLDVMKKLKVQSLQRKADLLAMKIKNDPSSQDMQELLLVQKSKRQLLKEGI